MQILRFVAALMVLISHLEREVQSTGLGASVSPVMESLAVPWSCGVDLFFCISGFLMLYLTWDNFATPGYSWEFIKRRIIRVAPLYWIFTAAFALVALTVPSVVLHGDITPSRFVSSLFFIPTARADGTIYPVLIAGWTLNYEALFYVVFGIGLFFRKHIALTAIVVMFSCASVWHLLSPSGPIPVIYWTNPIIMEFVFGIFAAYFYLKGVRLTRSFRAAFVVAGIAALITLNKLGLADTETVPSILPRSLWAGIPAALILVGMMYGPQLEARSILVRWLILGGNASYALYLSHMFATRAVSVTWRVAHLHSGWGFMAAGVIVATALSILVFKYVETPLLAVLRRRFEPKRDMIAA